MLAFVDPLEEFMVKLGIEPVLTNERSGSSLKDSNERSGDIVGPELAQFGEGSYECEGPARGIWGRLLL
jgi:hypothetical protein